MSCVKKGSSGLLQRCPVTAASPSYVLALSPFCIASQSSEGDEKDLTLGAESDGNPGNAYTATRESKHAVMVPLAMAQSSGCSTVSEYGSDGWNADLAAVGVSAKIKPGIVSGGFPIDFIGVRQEDAEGTLWHILERDTQIVAPEMVGIVDAYEPDLFAIALDGPCVVDEKANSQSFHGPHHFQAVMVAEDTQDSVL